MNPVIVEEPEGEPLWVGGGQSQGETPGRAQRTLELGLKGSISGLLGREGQKGALEAEGTALQRRGWKCDAPGMWKDGLNGGCRRVEGLSLVSLMSLEVPRRVPGISGTQ